MIGNKKTGISADRFKELQELSLKIQKIKKNVISRSPQLSTEEAAQIERFFEPLLKSLAKVLNGVKNN